MTVNVATTTAPATLQTKTGTRPARRERRQLVRLQRGQQVNVTNVTGGATELMSTPGGGTAGNAASGDNGGARQRGRDLRNGGVVAFSSDATNLGGNNAGVRDIFVRVRGGNVSAFSESATPVPRGRRARCRDR